MKLLAIIGNNNKFEMKRFFLDPFEKKVLKTVEKYSLLEKGDRVLVSFSGGPDSQALLSFLLSIESLFELEIGVFHLNHKLREEADEEEKLIREQIKNLGLRDFIYSYDVRAFAKENKLSLEDAGRKIRYQFLERISEENNYNKIALGHQLNDSVETFLMRFIRGTSLEGLRGIAPKREKFIRPLIEVEKEEIESYLNRKEIDYFIDRSNLSGKNLRSRVRHYLIPYFLTVNPRFHQAVKRLMEVFEEENELLEETAEKLFKKYSVFLNGGVELRLKKPAQQTIWRRLAKKAYFSAGGVRVDFRHLDRIAKLVERGRGKVSLPGGIEAVVKDRRTIYFGRPKGDEAESLEFTEVYFRPPGEKSLSSLGYLIKGEFLEYNSELARKIKSTPSTVALLDVALLKLPLIIRTWKKGDTFYPLGLGKPKKLQDFFVDKKIPRVRRHRIPLVESKGNIVWVGGLMIDDRFKVTEKTKRVLRLELVKEKKNGV